MKRATRQCLPGEYIETFVPLLRLSSLLRAPLVKEFQEPPVDLGPESQLEYRARLLSSEVLV
jgi:hypothetical protein